MKAIVQRVLKASVTVGDEIVGSIGPGICVLLGISKDDNQKDTEYMVRKILNLRVFEDKEGKRWAKGVKDMDLEVLCISQFTLQCILKGNKPDFHGAMASETSKALFDSFIQQLGISYDPAKIQQGRFGAYMQVHIQNDGPVTIELSSPLQKQGKKGPKETNEKKSSIKQQEDSTSAD